MISWNVPTADALKVTLKYRGKSVDDGTMPVSDVVKALHGFSGAYGKVASRETPNVKHELRVSAVESGSFKLVIFAAAVILQDPSVQQALITVATDATRAVLNTLSGLIRSQQHTKGKPATYKIDGNNNTMLVFNNEGASLSIPIGVGEIFQEGIVASELAKIVSPLRKGEVDSAELSVEGADDLTTSVDSSEREYFDTTTVETTTTKETRVEGQLVSLNKDRNSGTFRLSGGATVRYHYEGPNENEFYQDFAAKGAVRVTCTATLDDDLQPVRLTITGVERLQRSLPFQPDKSSSNDQT